MITKEIWYKSDIIEMKMLNDIQYNMNKCEKEHISILVLMSFLSGAVGVHKKKCLGSTE